MFESRITTAARQALQNYTAKFSNTTKAAFIESCVCGGGGWLQHIFQKLNACESVLLLEIRLNRTRINYRFLVPRKSIVSGLMVS